MGSTGSNQTPESPVVDMVTDAIDVLGKSERGRRVIEHLYNMLDEGGLALDSEGKRAIGNLLQAAWNGRAGTVLASLENAMRIKLAPAVKHPVEHKAD